MAGLPIFTQRFFEQLSEGFHRQTVIVFDNYHEVPLESLIHQLLPVGIEQLPRHVRVVVLSRERPPTTYARLQAGQQLSIIDATELELTREEARQVSYLKLGSLQNKGVLSRVDQLLEVTKGWMAGFILLLEHQARKSSQIVQLGTPQAIFDLLAGEVMDHFPQETQNVLLTMSILPEFTLQIAQCMSLDPNAAEILEQVHQSGYFMERREDSVDWYRFHPLFQEFLLRRIEKVWQPTAVNELRRKAAALLVEAHREEEAISLLQRAQAWDDYRTLVRTQAPLLAQQGRTQTLETWITQLPDVQRDRDPWMDFWLANSRLLHVPKEAAILYESAMTRFRQQGERAGMLLAWSGAVQSILIAWSGMKRLHDLVRLFDEMYAEGTGYPSLEVEAVVAQAMAGAYMHLYPEQSKAREWLDRSVHLVHALPPAMRGSEIVMTTIYYLWLGDGEMAQAISAEQRRLCATETSMSMRLMLATTEATLAWYSGQVERCREAVQYGLELAEREGLFVWKLLLYAQAVYNELMVGNVQMARKHLDLMQHVATFGGDLFIFLMLGAWADLMEGMVDQARQKCRQARAILEAEGFIPWHAGMLHLFEAQLALTRGHREKVERCLDKVATITKMFPAFYSFGACFLRAQCAVCEGDEPLGTMWLRRLMAEAKKRRQIIFVGWIPQQASQLFAKALEHGIEAPYACEVIRKWQLKPPPDGSELAQWPFRIRIHTLGELIVEIDGKSMEKQRKAPHRLLELLTAIITFGAHDVPVSRLTDAMWPESEGDTAKENFKKSITRLRKLLAVEDVIHWEDGKISLNQDLCWVDVLAFEKQVKREDSLAIALYTGPFLGHDEIPAWATVRREQVRTRFISLVDRHCEQVQAEGNATAAIHSLQHAIDVDPLVEHLYQRLIPLLMAQGRQTDALRYYQTCLKAYQQSGTQDLSPATLRLAQSFKN
jgi:ATP/maltotriose-dependent transcriptional regulator MalT/DNA-binding SARP family transcriptional activator